MVPILKMRRFSCLLRLSLPPEMGEIDFSPFHSIVNIHPPPLIPISRLRLVHWSTLKIAHDLPIFASYYAFVVFSHLIGLLSVTWLSHSYKFTLFQKSLSFCTTAMFVVHDVEQRAKAREKTENENDTFIQYRVNRVGFSYRISLRIRYKVNPVSCERGLKVDQ